MRNKGNKLDKKHLYLGQDTRQLLPSLGKEERELFCHYVKTIYHAIAAYLKSNLPLYNLFLRDMQVLDSSNRFNQGASDAIVRIGRSVPGLLSSNEIYLLHDKWLSYSLENIDETWIVKRKYSDLDRKEHLEYQRVDFY